MPSYSRNAFTLEEAHAAATAAGFKPSRLGNRGRFSFNSRACHVGGDNPNGCWATERDGRVYFHCHRHGDGKAAWMGAQHRITANLGLPEYRRPEAVAANRPYQVREWTYHNELTGEDAVQVVERYDGACWREDCGDRFAHKHPWLKRDEKWKTWPTDGFLLLEHAAATPKTPENAPCISPVNGKPCNNCNHCNGAAVRDRQQNGDGIGNWGVIAEGETTAEATAACGWRAFSYQGGSNGSGRADYSPVAGMNILIAPDHDRPGTKAALTAAIRCIEAGAREVRIMPTDAFSRRGEDLADLGIEQRTLVIEDGWFAPLRNLGPLILELAGHSLDDRCLAATKRPLVAATQQEHFDDHVGAGLDRDLATRGGPDATEPIRQGRQVGVPHHRRRGRPRNHRAHRRQHRHPGGLVGVLVPGLPAYRPGVGAGTGRRPGRLGGEWPQSLMALRDRSTAG